jgi:hypothetical protein
MAAKKMGRPPKPPDEVRAGVYQLRLTADERAEYDRAAERAGVNLSEWIRASLTKAARRGSGKP